MTDKEGLLLELAEDLGFEELWSEEGEHVLGYRCTEEQLLEFAKRIEEAK